jgi:hypothetical protein
MSEKVSTSAVNPQAGPPFAWWTMEPEPLWEQFCSAPGGHTTR